MKAIDFETESALDKQRTIILMSALNYLVTHVPLRRVTQRTAVVPSVCGVQMTAGLLEESWPTALESLAKRLTTPGIIRGDELDLPHGVEYAKRLRERTTGLSLRLLVYHIPIDPVGDPFTLIHVAQFDIAVVEFAE